MSTAAQTWTIIGAVAVIVGIQTLWIVRRLGSINKRLERIDRQLARLETRT